MRIELDGRKMTNRAAAHVHLQVQLALPDAYGRNLDALYDLLTERGEPTQLVLYHSEALDVLPGGYGTALLATLRDAAQDNPALEFLLV